ncbi:MAG TPA: ROK family protein [Burkholderiales bacterium]|nr:ROK family protein [Burkholderiales bacterium]
MNLRLGIDLGGTKIEVLALEDGRERLRRRIATPAGDYDATLDAVAALVAQAESEIGARGTVGVATPGALSPASGLLRNSNSTCLNGRPLKQDLERRLGREIRVANDANCFALSEAVDGAAAGEAVVFGVILGTGVGGGVVVNRHPLTGVNAVAGEWGHNPLPWPEDAERPGPPCYCGKTGCIETFLSGPGFARDHGLHTGHRIAPQDIVAGAAAGDAGCEASLVRYETRLARALATVINLLDPDAIVLGGGLSNIARLYDRVPGLWSRWVFSDVVRTRLLPHRHGDSSGVRGAAWLWE